MESEERHDETQDPGLSEAPAGVPPAETDEAPDGEIDEQPQGSEEADAGEPHGGGATDSEDESSDEDSNEDASA